MQNNHYDMTISNSVKELNEGSFNQEFKGIEKEYSEKEIEHARKLFPIISMNFHYGSLRLQICELLNKKNIFVTVEHQTLENGKKMPKVWNRYKVFKNDTCVFDAEDNTFPRTINHYTVGSWEEELLDTIKQAKEKNKESEVHYTLRLK